jgi:5'-deoxynucleotidase YfbR-like HD superfamily hydrolase
MAVVVEFLQRSGELKGLARQGWVDRGVPNPESVADHTYRVAVMALVLGELAGLDTGRLAKLALLHDLPEIELGDTTPYQPVLDRGARLEEALLRWRELLSPEELAAKKQEKETREAQAVAGLVAHLPSPVAAAIQALWTEYREGRSPEARFAAQLDKVEALLQAMEYQRAGHEADVENFLASARASVDHPVLRAVLAEIEVLARPISRP